MIRSGKACEPCRKRRTKCGAPFPCKTCVKVGCEVDCFVRDKARPQRQRRIMIKARHGQTTSATATTTNTDGKPTKSRSSRNNGHSCNLETSSDSFKSVEVSTQLQENLTDFPLLQLRTLLLSELPTSAASESERWAAAMTTSRRTSSSSDDILPTLPSAQVEVNNSCERRHRQGSCRYNLDPLLFPDEKVQLLASFTEVVLPVFAIIEPGELQGINKKCQDGKGNIVDFALLDAVYATCIRNSTSPLPYDKRNKLALQLFWRCKNRLKQAEVSCLVKSINWVQALWIQHRFANMQGLFEESIESINLALLHSMTLGLHQATSGTDFPSSSLQRDHHQRHLSILFFHIYLAHIYICSVTCTPPILNPAEIDTLIITRIKSTYYGDVESSHPQKPASNLVNPKLVDQVLLIAQVLFTTWNHHSENSTGQAKNILECEMLLSNSMNRRILRPMALDIEKPFVSSLEGEAAIINNNYSNGTCKWSSLSTIWFRWIQIVLRLPLLQRDCLHSTSSLAVCARSALNIIQSYKTIYRMALLQSSWSQLQRILGCAYVALLCFIRNEMVQDEAESLISSALCLLYPHLFNSTLGETWATSIPESESILAIADSLGLNVRSILPARLAECIAQNNSQFSLSTLSPPPPPQPLQLPQAPQPPTLPFSTSSSSMPTIIAPSNHQLNIQGSKLATTKLVDDLHDHGAPCSLYNLPHSTSSYPLSGMANFLEAELFPPNFTSDESWSSFFL